MFYSAEMCNITILHIEKYNRIANKRKENGNTKSEDDKNVSMYMWKKNYKLKKWNELLPCFIPEGELISDPIHTLICSFKMYWIIIVY